jgi:hypothetical protein
VSQADANAHHTACLAAGGVSVQFPEVDFACQNRHPNFGGGALATDTYAYINEVFCFNPAGACAQFETSFCTQFDDVHAGLHEIALEEAGFTDVDCTPAAGAEQCNFINAPPTPSPTPALQPVVIRESFLQCAVSCLC